MAVIQVLRILVWIVSLAGVGLLQPVLAQNEEIRVIPAFGDLFGFDVSPDGRYAATYENSPIHSDEVLPGYLPIRVYDLETGERVALLSGHTDYPTDIAFSPDGTTLAAYEAPGFIYIWAIPSGERLSKIPAVPGARLIEFVGDGSTIAILQAQPMMVQLWDTATGAMTGLLLERQLSQLAMREAAGEGIPDAGAAWAIAPDRRQIAIVTLYGNIWLWDLETQEGRLVRESTSDQPMISIRSLVFGPEGDELYYVESREGYIGVIDTTTGEETAQLPVNRPMATALDISPDGTTLAWIGVGAEDNDRLVLTPLDNPEAQREIELPQEQHGLRRGQERVEFTPDGDAVVSGSLLRPDSDPPSQNAIFVVDL